MGVPTAHLNPAGLFS